MKGDTRAGLPSVHSRQELEFMLQLGRSPLYPPLYPSPILSAPRSSVICAFSLHAEHMRFLLLHSAHALVVSLTMRAAR